MEQLTERKILLLFFSIIFASGILAQITPHEAIKQMQKGINLGNTHEPPTEAGWNNPKAQEYYFDLYKDAGFDCVRIPARYDNYTGKTPPYKMSDAWLNRIEEVAEWGLKRGLFIVRHNKTDKKSRKSNGDSNRWFTSRCLHYSIFHRFKALFRKSSNQPILIFIHDKDFQNNHSSRTCF